MSPHAFLLSWAGLVAGTYVMRLLGVKFGASLATKGDTSGRVPPASSAEQRPSDRAASPGSSGAARTTAWTDRATVVLIAAVAATSAVFDGKHLADPSLILGVGAGILAAALKAPMFVCVIIGMAVCAGLRFSGLL